MICENCKSNAYLQAVSVGKCSICDKETPTPHLPSYTICEDCSFENSICEQCGKKIENLIYESKTCELIKSPKEMIDFLNEIESICKKYNFSIGHEDKYGSFIIEEYNKDNIGWLKDAWKGY